MPKAKKTTRLITWNVNGIRACQKSGFVEWFNREEADLVCLQETKAHRDQLDIFLLNPAGYTSYWHSAEKPGYSGVAVYVSESMGEPLSVKEGFGISNIDSEGRVLQLEFADFTLINAYFPNSQRDHARLGYKLEFCKQMLKTCQKIRAAGKNVVVCGDFNIAHQEIDLKNPKTNVDNAGFLPEEREWMTQFLDTGYTDTFRHFVKDPGHYTWWSYRPGVRERNIGWRLDYFVCNQEMNDRLVHAEIYPQIKGSDHCPVLLEIAAP